MAKRQLRRRASLRRGERRHGRPGGDRSRQEGDSSRPGGVNPGPEGQLGAPGAPRRGGESACAACCMLSLCRSVRGHPTWRQGASDGLLGGVAAARGAATLTPPAWHRAATRVSGWPAEPGLRARGQLQRPCKHGAHGGLEAAVACLWDAEIFSKWRPAAGAAWYIFFEGKGPLLAELLLGLAT